MRLSDVSSGAAILALVAGLAVAEEMEAPEHDAGVGPPGVSDPWIGSDDGDDDHDHVDGDDADDADGGKDDSAGPDRPEVDDHLHDAGDGGVIPDQPDSHLGQGDDADKSGDGIAAPTCIDCGPVDEAAEVVVTGAPRSVDRREARQDWREIHGVSRRNVCFEADLYVPLLCDWQRPFLGDRMP